MHRVGLATVGRIDTHRARAIRQDECVAKTAHPLIDGIPVVQTVQIAEIIRRPAHHIRQTHVLFDMGHHLRQVGDMVLAEIDVIIEPCACPVCLPQQPCHGRPYRGIDGKKRAEKHHILLAYLWHRTIQPYRRMVLIEHILRIVVLIQKSQRDMRLDMLVAADIVRRHAILVKIVANHIAHMVASHLCHHSARHPCASERHDAVERRASRHSLLRLVVLKQNVQHRLPYSYHPFLGHDKKTISPVSSCSAHSLWQR